MKSSIKKVPKAAKKTVALKQSKTPAANMANEPIINYSYQRPDVKNVAYPMAHNHLQVSIAQGATLLSNSNNRPESQLTAFDKMNFIRIGVSIKELEGFKNKATLDYDQLASALSVTRATLINKKGNDKFNPSLSERIISLADIYSYGYKVFEYEARFNAWMFSPNQALGGLLPFKLMDNQFGREEIKNMIGRIEYGVYA